MKQKINVKVVFWCSTLSLFVLNILGVLIFKKHVNLSSNSLFAAFVFIFMLLRGIFAYSVKDDQYFFLRKHIKRKFNKYNWPTKEQLKEFYIKATIYFSLLPFYLPIAAFSSKTEHGLWCVLLLFISQVGMIGVEIRKIKVEKTMLDQEEAKLKKEKEEQERREELGHWK